MAVAKIYNTGTMQWEPVIVGKQGPVGDPGVYQGAEAPTDTTLLWVDTDDAADPVAVPSGGTAGQILQKSTNADYDTAWSNPPSHNYIINGAFEVNQRNLTSTAATSGFVGDRFQYSYNTGTTTVSLESLPAGEVVSSNFGSIPRFAKFSITEQDSASGNVRMFQRIEDVRVLDGQDITVSFYAKASTNMNICVSLEKYYGSGGSGSNFDVNPTTSPTITTSWQRHSITIPNTSAVGKTIGPGSFTLVSFWISAGTNLAAVTNSLGVNNNDFYITGIQVEGGSVPTPFRRHALSYNLEEEACKKYYLEYDFSVVFLGGPGLTATKWNASDAIFANLFFPTTMRVAPTFTRSISTARYVNSGSASTPTVNYSNAHIRRDMISVAYVNNSVAAGSGWIDGMGIWRFDAEL